MRKLIEAVKRLLGYKTFRITTDSGFIIDITGWFVTVSDRVVHTNALCSVFAPNGETEGDTK